MHTRWLAAVASMGLVTVLVGCDDRNHDLDVNADTPAVGGADVVTTMDATPVEDTIDVTMDP